MGRNKQQGRELFNGVTQRFHEFCDAVTAGIVVHDVTGAIVHANKAACEILSLTLDQLLGKTSYDPDWQAVREDGSSFPGHDHPAMVTLRTGDPVRNVVMGIYSYKSDFRWISVDSKPIVDSKTGVIDRVLVTFVDITARKRWQRALHDSEQRFRNLVEASSDWIWEVDENLVYTYVSPRVRDLLGYEPEEVLGKTPFDLMPESEARRVFDAVAGPLALRKAFAFLENTNVHKNGHQVVLETSGVPFFDSRGNFCGYRGIDRDITQRKHVEEALRKQRDFTSATLDTVGSLVVVLDREGHIIRFNRACERTTGYAFEEVQGRILWDLFLIPEEKEAVKAVFEDLCCGNSGSDRQGLAECYKNHWLTKHGERRLIAWSNTCLVDRSGSVEFIIGTGIDITDKQRADEALRHSEAFLRMITDAIPARISYVDTQLRFQFVNKRYEDWFGNPREEIIGKHIADILEPTVYEKILPHVRTALSGKDVAYELTVETRPREERYLRIAYLPHFGSKGDTLGFFGLVEDITERRRLEEQLRQSQKMEAVGALAGGIAHDFNNLLTVITGSSQLVLEQLVADDPLSKEVEEIKKAAERAATLTQQLLAFSRKQILQPRVIDLNTVVADLERMLRRLIGENIDVRIVLTPTLEAVKADPGQIAQIIVNLAVNAQDAMPGGGKLTIETRNVELDEAYIRIHIGVRPGRYVMLSVTDTGHGMSPETKEHLFEPFFTTKELGRGTGLGLSTIYGIVKQTGGHIEVYTELGFGTAFKIYLPVIEGFTGPVESRRQIETSSEGDETILLVEDDPALRKLENQMLATRGYTVLEASDGKEALRIASGYQAPIHLLLTDVVMPGLSGYEVAQGILQRRPETKVLYLSGYADSAILHQAVLDPDLNFLQKPFTTDALVRRVRQLLDGNPKARGKAGGQLDST